MPRAKVAAPSVFTTADYIVVVSFKDTNGQHDKDTIVTLPTVTSAERQEIATLLNYGVIKPKD